MVDPHIPSSSSKLISSDRVKGTEVYGTDGKHIGEIDRLMIDKVSGHVEHVMMGFGGFLGLGEKHYAIPWAKLKYDTEVGGYVTDLTAEMVRDAPEYDPGIIDEEERAYRKVNDYYSTRGYWDGGSVPARLRNPSKR